MNKVAFLIDGWFMRKRIYALRPFDYSGPKIRDYCRRHLRKDADVLYRIFYYDTEPLQQKGHHPVTGRPIDFSKTDVAVQQNALFKSIKHTPNFALRPGKTVWRNKNWILSAQKTKALLSKKITVDDIEARDVAPQIEQKAVDMKIGLDIATLSLKRLVDRIIIITGDSDLVPAIKQARIEGLQVGLDPLWATISEDLLEHVDFVGTKFPKPR